MRRTAKDNKKRRNCSRRPFSYLYRIDKKIRCFRIIRIMRILIIFPFKILKGEKPRLFKT